MATYTYEDIINQFSSESRETEALGDLINLFGLVSNPNLNLKCNFPILPFKFYEINYEITIPIKVHS